LPYMEFSGYCQKIELDETRSIQFHANGTTPTVFIKRFEDDVIFDTVVATLVDTSIKEQEDLVEVTFGIYQASLTFDTAGSYYVSIETNGGANVIRSEPISVGTFLDTVLVKISNDKNTDLNVWNAGFEVQFRVEAQFYKLLPESERTVFRGSDNRGLVLTQKNKRGVRLDVFNVPPYMHEVLTYGFSLDTIDVDGQLFYSESGYSEITYQDRFSLANGTTILFTKFGFGDQAATVAEVDLLVDDNGDFLIDDNNDNLIDG